MGDGHSVLSQRSRFVRANGGRRTKGFHGLEILYQAVLARHSFRRKSEAHSYGGDETLGYVGDDNT